MSIQNAYKFIQKIRKDELVKKKIQSLENISDLKSYVKFGKDLGLDFTVEDLRIAYKHDWGIRWRYYSKLSEANGQRF